MVKFFYLVIVSIGLMTIACEKNLEPNSLTGESSLDDHTNHDHSRIDSYYTCSMHPQIREEGPGKCPICFMNLTKVEVETSTEENTATNQAVNTKWRCKDFEDVTSEVEGVCPVDGSPMILVQSRPKAGEIIAKIKLNKSQKSHFRPTFFPVTPMKMTRDIRLLGDVIQSEEKESSIPARVAGRVEKVYVNSTGSLVKPGDPVLDIYSPQLITAGEEYILARRSVANGQSDEFENMLKQSKRRLELWGIKPRQYESWFQKGKVPRNITVYSNTKGVVRKRNANQGKYFEEGQNFFELTDLSSVWVEMDVYEHDASLVKLGQTVSLKFTALPGKVLKGEIDFISPVLNPKSRTLKVRATIANDEGILMPGMVADATLKVSFENTPLVVPRGALIDTGKRKVVWVRLDSDRYQARLVATGVESDGYVAVLEGLDEGDQVVAEGNFLLDAQAQLFGGYEDFGAPGSANSVIDHH